MVNLIQYMKEILYPVGSIFISTDINITTSTLASLYGGTWSKITATNGCMVAASGSTFAINTSNGNDNGYVISHTHSSTTAGSEHTHSSRYTADCSASKAGDPVHSDNTVAKSGVFYSSGAHTHSTSSTSSSYAVFNANTNLNIPPYITVNYFWRTA